MGLDRLEKLDALTIRVKTNSAFFKYKTYDKAASVASKFVKLLNDLWVGSWFPPNCTTSLSVRTVALVRSKNGEYVARKGIPADVREAYRSLCAPCP